MEDDSMIASGLIYALEQEGYTVIHCKDVQTAYHAVQADFLDLAILDMQLPDGTGFDISQRLKNTNTAIIFVTIVDDEGMKITAKLAYSQLKINRSRTVWTLIGIALSTALITAVCSFVACGNTMIVNMLGTDYGEYGQSYIGLLLVPAIFLGIIVVSMSVVVVSNVFRVSAKERTAQFGILKSVGATKEQIMTTVMYESLLVSVVGIPIGIGIGLLLAFGGISVANHYLDELTSLVHMMMREITLVLDFVVSWQALLAAAGISFFTVLFSAWLPAHKAARVTAIDSIRNTGEVKVEAKSLGKSLLVQKFFGYEGVLAAKNMKRNRRVFRATVISLCVGIVLFITLSSLNQQAKALETLWR